MRFPVGLPIITLALCALLAACSGGGGGSSSGNDPSSGDDGTDNSGGATGGGGTGGDDTGGGGATSQLNIASDTERAYFYGDFQTAFDDVEYRATLEGPTPLISLPSSGSVDYAGFMEVKIGNSTVTADVRGSAMLTVAMADGATTGGAHSFMGVVLDDAMTPQVVNYAGEVTFSGGAISQGLGDIAGLSFDINGALDSGENTFGISGELSGFFYDPEANGLRVTGSEGGFSDDIDATIDGSAPVPLGIATIWAVAE